MALKQLILSRKLAEKQKQRDALQRKLDEIAQKREAMAKREAELEAAVQEITEETAEEVKTEVEAAVAEFEAEVEALDTEEQEAGKTMDALEEAIDALQEDLDNLADKVETAAEEVAEAEEEETAPAESGERSVTPMNKRTLIADPQTRAAFLKREDVVRYLGEVRSAIREKRAITGVGLTIPDVMLDLVRQEIAHRSRLLPFVRVRPVGGKSRQNIAGAIPEAVWTEMCASLNELTLAFNQMEVDGFKVGGYLAICNAALEDSDYNLAEEIVSAIGGAIAKALDKAILFGTGNKMPTGIVTRLAQTSQPAGWGANAPAWTDLHSTNVQTLNIGSETGVAFFQALIEKLAIAKPYDNADGLFWVMNRKTHLKVLSKALAFDASAALLANITTMPIIGGTIVEFEDEEIQDNEIIGGFGGNYLLAERAGIEFASSDIPLFLQDQTVFKGTARYDGAPIFGEAFVVVNFANTSPTTTAAFPTDYANATLNDLTITAAVGGTSGKTVLTVSGTIAQSSPDLYYKLGVIGVKVGDALPTGFEELTSGTTNIAAAAGKKITVVELDGNDRIVSAGTVISVPKT